MVVARHASGEEQQSREPALARRLAQAQVDAPTGHPSRELRRRRLRVPRLTGPGRGVSNRGDAPAHGVISPRTWGKVIVGLLVIGGTLSGLWAAFRPSLPGVETEASRPAAVPALRDARAALVLSSARSPRTWRAVIACDGRRRSATGFWARRPAAACDALAATRGALLAGAGCRRTLPGRWRLHVTGSFGGRRVDHRAQHGGCPDPDGWLAVNALVLPILPPEQNLTEAERRG